QQILELHKPDRSPQLVKPVVESQHRYIVVRRTAIQALVSSATHSMSARLAYITKDGWIRCDHGTAFRRRNVLVSIEAERRGIAECGYFLEAGSMGGIGEQVQVLSSRKIAPGLRIGNVSREMDENDRL